MASFHGSPLVRNGSTAKPGTNVSVVMFNGYDDSGVKPEAKAAVQVRAAPCLAGGVYAGALHAMLFLTSRLLLWLCLPSKRTLM